MEVYYQGALGGCRQGSKGVEVQVRGKGGGGWDCGGSRFGGSCGGHCGVLGVLVLLMVVGLRGRVVCGGCPGAQQKVDGSAHL